LTHTALEPYSPVSTTLDTFGTHKFGTHIQNQHYASQPKNSTATRKRTGYRVMNKTDTHSDIIFYIYLNITLSDKNMLFNANTANNSKINLLKVEL